MTTHLLKQLQLPPGTRTASLETRLDGKVLGRETRNTGCAGAGGRYSIGVDLTIEADAIRIESWTVEDGKHVLNFRATVTHDGKMISGTVNCFGFGMQPIDQGYLDDFYAEMEESRTKWDRIE